MKTLVSLVSEQTIPNILGILHCNPDALLFLSTQEMERAGKVDAILGIIEQRRPGAFRLGENAHVLVVQEDSILDCHRKLEEWIAGREDSEFVVNITCGTKLMSIAAFEYFKDYDSRMIYMPVARNDYLVPFPKKTPRAPTPLPERLGVAEYLTAYGLEVLNVTKLGAYRKLAEGRKDLSRLAAHAYRELAGLLGWFGEWLREKRNIKKSIEFSEMYRTVAEKERAFLEGFGFTQEGDCWRRPLNRGDIAYLTGGWLEEYCFNCVAQLLGRGVDDVTLNITIKNRQGRDNEFDVMFTANNTLYFIECKSLEQLHDKKFDSLYKIGALQKEFGLRVKSFLVTTSSLILDPTTGEVKSDVAERATQFNTRVVRPEEIPELSAVLARELKLQGEETPLGQPS